MTQDRTSNLRNRLLDEISEELNSLSGDELDSYLSSIGLDPAALVAEYDDAVAAVAAKAGRLRFEEARRAVALGQSRSQEAIVSLDLVRKKKIAAAVKERAEKTGEMTIAARNQKFEDEGDLDSFLEACVRLGLVDDEGNLRGEGA
uniref:Uncharacterized protein n=1 Tax=Rhodopseudomonas palustris (strain BisA53) TaxID=316055 RepID=Q07NQ0_RHOP5